MTVLSNVLFTLFFFFWGAAVLLKKFSGEEGERVDVQKLFGYIGLCTLVALWWLGKRFSVVFTFFLLEQRR